jgi:hypothetical protein
MRRDERSLTTALERAVWLAWLAAGRAVEDAVWPRMPYHWEDWPTDVALRFVPLNCGAPPVNEDR